MSEKTRRVCGLFLILICLVLCLFGTTVWGKPNETHFRSGLMQDRGIPEISTEEKGTVALNLDDAEELTVLPGVGETIAALIVTEREKNGPFHYAEDLEAVKGIGPKTLDGFRDMIDLTEGESGE